MKPRRVLVVALLVVAAFTAASCRGAQIRNLDERVDQLQNRIVALEAKVEMLTKK